MSVPWRFIMALVAGVILGIAAFIGALYSQLGIPTETSHWLYAILTKKEQRAAAIPGPRLLIIAGSSSLFGINAQVIQQETGYPTINMAAHAGLNLDFLLYYIKKTARAGDTIYMPLEYVLYDRTFNSESHDDYILAREPAFFHQMSWAETISLATRLRFVRLQLGWRDLRHPEHVRAHAPYEESIDNNGDGTNNKAVDRQPNAPAMSLKSEELLNGLPSDHTAEFDRLREFIAWARANHIRLIAGFPNIIRQPEYDGPNAKETIQTITNFYTSEGVPVIGNAQEVMLPSEDFYDTCYHLTHEAAIERTKRLVPELLPYLQDKR